METAESTHPLVIFGEHDDRTVAQMQRCMDYGSAVQGVLCADGHLGYAQPVGGVIAYEGHVSISGVGFDIGCGNLAARTDLPYAAIKDRREPIMRDIARKISFGLGRVNKERVEHPLFDSPLWADAGIGDLKQIARNQLGTVGSGNHYIDLFEDEAGQVWIGVHFGSRGLGHQTASRFMKAAGGEDGMEVAPALVEDGSELGERYVAGMRIAGEYAYAGREWVVEQVRQILGAEVTESVHNHHNYAWRERHGGRDFWVVRKGATPAFPGQKGFVGGSMGDDAVIIEGVDGPRSAESLYSTVHGAGRLFSRSQARKTFQRSAMDAWLSERDILLHGADLDESPMAYRRLGDVLAFHGDTIRILHRLRPVLVMMAGRNERDPYKD
ncbi:MAG: RtcB family protein [Rhizobiales bacterium]|nr:RtcB family protein [Hyphomicrobiales bacterium]